MPAPCSSRAHSLKAASIASRPDSANPLPMASWKSAVPSIWAVTSSAGLPAAAGPASAAAGTTAYVE